MQHLRSAPGLDGKMNSLQGQSTAFDTSAFGLQALLDCYNSSSLQGYLTALDASASRLQALGQQAAAAGVPKEMLRVRAVDLKKFSREVVASLEAQASVAQQECVQRCGAAKAL